VNGIFGQAGYGRISQGFLETSNVSVVEEMVRMITGQRSYEANTKVITTADEMGSQAVSIKR
jgi:flagellar basal-body rod protein FlgG